MEINMGEEIYTLEALRRELVAVLDVKGVMEAYGVVAKETNKSIPVVRKWFTDPNNSSYVTPPQESKVWDYLEDISNGQLRRTTYHPKPTFWDNHAEE
jgi:hypothetical protein